MTRAQTFSRFQNGFFKIKWAQLKHLHFKDMLHSLKDDGCLVILYPAVVGGGVLALIYHKE